MAWYDFNAGQGAQGALGGAIAGGSIGGPLGAAIGGGLGLLGGFGGESEQDKFKKLLMQMQAGYQDRDAPQMGAAAQAGQSGLVGDRAALIAQLQAMARGEGPSAARSQMLDATDRNARGMAATAAGAGGRGVNQGAALRTAMGQGAALGAQNNRDMATVRAQEQMSAVGQLGQTIGYGISADQSLNQFNAGQTNDQAALNAQLQMQMLGLNDESQLRALMMSSGMQAPGLGTSLLAGAAQAAPMLGQLRQEWRQDSQQQQQQARTQQQQQAQLQQQQQQFMDGFGRSPADNVNLQFGWGPNGIGRV